MKYVGIAAVTVGLVMCAAVARADDLTTVDFNELPLAPDSYWNGADMSGGFLSRGVFFNNLFTDWGWGFYSWAGFAYSNVDDPVTPGYGNQYAVISGTGKGGTGNYAVVYDDAFDPTQDFLDLPVPSQVRGFFVNNTTYTALSMLNGDAFTKKFGGATGDDPDWFLLTITGKDTTGNQVGIVETYLADYRSADNAMDYVVDRWQWVDLTSLGPDLKSLHFTLSSSDVGPWGMNTPAYFAMDDLVLVPRKKWAKKPDVAVDDMSVHLVRAGLRRWLCADVTVANLGGQPASGWLMAHLVDPVGRTATRWRRLVSLRPGAKRTMRVYFMKMGHWQPKGTYVLDAAAWHHPWTGEITIRNNWGMDTFDW